MRLLSRFQHTHTSLSEADAERLTDPGAPGHTVEVKPPRNGDLPATFEEFVRGIMEHQSKYLKLWNTSPTVVYELRRSRASELRFQFTVPTTRLERKLRTHLTAQVPGVEFGDGATGLPVTEESTVGGGFLVPGRKDWFPFRTRFDDPPINALTAALHRHAMRDTRVVIQLLFRPVAGRSIRDWWWRRRAFQRRNYLKKEKEKLWGSRQPTPRERTQADQVERKAGLPRFHTAIRILVIGAGEYTPSRLKEIAGGFNIHEDLDSGQYFDAVTLTPLLESRLTGFADAVATRAFPDWALTFRTSIEELAALVTLPSRTDHKHIQYAQP